MGQILNEELASQLHGHSKVSLEERMDALFPGQTWMKNKAEAQESAAKEG